MRSTEEEAEDQEVDAVPDGEDGGAGGPQGEDLLPGDDVLDAQEDGEERVRGQQDREDLQVKPPVERKTTSGLAGSKLLSMEKHHSL